VRCRRAASGADVRILALLRLHGLALGLRQRLDLAQQAEVFPGRLCNKPFVNSGDK